MLSYKNSDTGFWFKILSPLEDANSLYSKMKEESSPRYKCCFLLAFVHSDSKTSSICMSNASIDNWNRVFFFFFLNSIYVYLFLNQAKKTTNHSHRSIWVLRFRLVYY